MSITGISHIKKEKRKRKLQFHIVVMVFSSKSSCVPEFCGLMVWLFCSFAWMDPSPTFERVKGQNGKLSRICFLLEFLVVFVQVSFSTLGSHLWAKFRSILLLGPKSWEPFQLVTLWGGVPGQKYYVGHKKLLRLFFVECFCVRVMLHSCSLCTFFFL